MGWLPDPLHPAIVHFPIALTLVALLIEVIARHPRARALGGAGLMLVVLAALGGVATVITGNAAHDDAVVPAAAESLMHDHEELGEKAMWALLLLAAVRTVTAWRGWFRGWLVWAYLVGMAFAAFMVGYNGHLGGQLVFRHGVGTAVVQRGGATPPPAAPHALPEMPTPSR